MRRKRLGDPVGGFLLFLLHRFRLLLELRHVALAAFSFSLFLIGHGCCLPGGAILESRGRGGTGRRVGFRTRWAESPWRFKSSRPHSRSKSGPLRGP